MYRFRNTFLLFSTLTIIPCAVHSKVQLRVAPSRPAEPGLDFVLRIVHTFQDKLNKSDEQHKCFCTGSAIKPTWTLTAAHCFNEHKIADRYFGSKYPKKTYMLNVVYDGTRNPAREGVTRTARILSREIHPNFSNFPLSNDIALCRTEPIQISRYGTISSVDFKSHFGYTMRSYGYGVTTITEPPYYAIAGDMQKPTLQVLEDVLLSSCPAGFMVGGGCLYPKCHGSPQVLCSGDSGGPLIRDHHILGVSSMSSALLCNATSQRKARVSGVVTPVSPYLQWIGNIIGDTD